LPKKFAKYEKLNSLKASYPGEYENATHSERFNKFNKNIEIFEESKNSILLSLGKSNLQKFESSLKKFKKIKTPNGILKKFGNVAKYTRRGKSIEKVRTQIGKNMKKNSQTVKDLLTSYYCMATIDEKINSKESHSLVKQAEKDFKKLGGKILSDIKTLEALVDKNYEIFAIDIENEL
jgi:hypothetical protein